MNSKYDLFIESFCDSVLTTTKGSYGGKWPMPFFTSLDVGMVVGDYWIDFFLEVINKFKEKGLGIENISKKIKYPSVLTRAIYPNVELKYKNRSLEKIEKKDLFISEVLFPLYKGEFYCKDYKNILKEKQEIENNFQEDKLIGIKNLVGEKGAWSYNGYLRAISEILYFYFDNLCHEIHGPYTLESGKVLLVREWHDLNPGYFEFMKSFPFESFRIYEIYSPGTDIKIDISNRVYIDTEAHKCLEGFYFETPEKIMGVKETKSFIEEIKNHCQKGVEEISSMDPVQILERASLMHFYILKPLTDILGISWRPNQECMERIKKGIAEEDKKPFQALMKLKLDEESIKKLFECRLDLPQVFYE